MPLYEYRCTKCGEVVEVLQKFSDPPLKRCKSCRGKVEKLVSRTAFHLKGGGWFNEGYGRGGSGKKSGSGKTEKKDSGSKKSKLTRAARPLDRPDRAAR
jgi:putative FmdB family regulatory protein